MSRINGSMTVGGCVPISAEKAKLQAEALEKAVRLPEYRWADKADMPVIKWDEAFDAWLDKRIALADKYEKKGLSLYPWDIYGALPAKIKRDGVFSWNQGPVPSCSMHGAAHAFQCAQLVSIGLGASMYYDAVNPIYSYYDARGGDMNGGLDLYTVADYVNKKGFAPARLVGNDNQRVSQNGLGVLRERGKEFQTGVVPIEDHLDERILKACRGLCSVCFGAGVLFTGCTRDQYGVKVMAGMQRGGHAQCFAGYLRRGGEEYVFNLNSYGNIYGGTTVGEPDCGAWVGRNALKQYCADMANYGLPFIAFCEGELRGEKSMVNDFELPKLKREGSGTGR